MTGVRTFVTREPVVGPASTDEARAHRLLFAAWGVPGQLPFLRLMIYSPEPGKVWYEQAVVTREARIDFACWHEVPDPKRRWPAQYRVTLYGIRSTWQLDPEPPVIGLAEAVEIPMHVLRVIGRYKDAPVYVELTQYPDGEAGPDLRAQSAHVSQDELIRAWKSVELLREVTRPGPRPWPLAKRLATLDDIERRMLAYRPATGLYQWRWTQEKLGLAVGVARETAIERLKRCLGKSGPDCWAAVQEWADALSLEARKLKPDDLPDGGHLRDLLGK